MIQASGIVLREAIEAILVIFIMVAYLQRTGELWKKKFVYGGAILAVGISVILGVTLTLVGINAENELVEGITFFVAAVLVASLVVWMWRKAKVIKREIEAKVALATSGLALGGIAFFMVLREGVETVIFLQSLFLTGTSPVQNFLGGLIGLGLALLFGFVFLKGITRINLARFFTVTSGILAVLVLKLIAGGLHEFMEVAILPSNQVALSVIGFFARDSTGAIIIALMMVGLMTLVIYDVATARAQNLLSLKPVEQRKMRYELAREKYTKISLGAVIIVVVMVILAPAVMAADITVPEPVPVVAQNGDIKVDMPKEDGFYKFAFGEARFFLAIKEGKPYVATDVCYICPPKGYGYGGKTLVCLNCDAPIEVETVGIPGGCNPRVIDFTSGKNEVIILAEELLNVWQRPKKF